MEQNIVLDGSKILWHQDRVKEWMAGRKIAPITIDCALTTHCTYRCVYCYGKMQCINQSDNLPWEVIRDFLTDAKEIGVKAVSFVSDGESTCSPYLKDAIVYGSNLGLSMALGTNGYLLKDEDLEEILPRLTYLRFNISAGEPERYAYIHGVSEKCFHKVVHTIEKAVAVKRAKHLPVTLGMQMVLMPEFGDQILPLANLGKKLGADYLVIKHCSDDENGTLGVDYEKYGGLAEKLHEAESYSGEGYLVKVKWSKILSHGKKSYLKCFGPQFMLQISGNGTVAPCGMFFHQNYSKYHMGNIRHQRLKDIWKSKRWDEVMGMICSDGFDPNKECGTLCLQHNTNQVLWKLWQQGDIPLPQGEQPEHINFV